MRKLAAIQRIVAVEPISFKAINPDF